MSTDEWLWKAGNARRRLASLQVAHCHLDALSLVSSSPGFTGVEKVLQHSAYNTLIHVRVQLSYLRKSSLKKGGSVIYSEWGGGGGVIYNTHNLSQ